MPRRCPTTLQIPPVLALPDAGRRPPPPALSLPSLRTSASPVTAYFTALTPSGCTFPPEATEILPRLYISDLYTAESPATYRVLGITHVVSAMQGPVIIPTPPSPTLPPTPTSPTTPTITSPSASSPSSSSPPSPLPPAHLQLPLSDQPFSELAAYLPTSTSFIATALSDPTARVLVHCVKGISRSVSVVVAYIVAAQLLHYQQLQQQSPHLSQDLLPPLPPPPMSVSEAIDFVQSKRPVAKPNFGFITQLEEYVDRVRCEGMI